MEVANKGLLFGRHPPVVAAAYSDLKGRALEQRLVLVGTPGSVDERTVAGRRFFYRQFYDAEGKRGADYLGPVDDKDAIERAQLTRERIAEASALLRDTRDLAHYGYVRVEPRVSAILAALFNEGLFRGGAVLVGSHAYGALLNDLGVRAAGFSTEDVDIARGDPLDVALPPEASLETVLAASRVPLLPVPGFGRHAPSTSFKVKGARLRVDLLAPGSTDGVSVKAVPELRAHATALPFLKYLLEGSRDGVVLGKENVTPVRLPRAERMALHKVLVAELRGATRDKRSKDLQQAGVLIAVLLEEAPGALEDAWRDLPRGARSKMKSALAHVGKSLARAGHVRAAEELNALVSNPKN